MSRVMQEYSPTLLRPVSDGRTCRLATSHRPAYDEIQHASRREKSGSIQFSISRR